VAGGIWGIREHLVVLENMRVAYLRYRMPHGIITAPHLRRPTFFCLHSAEFLQLPRS
jgi:hypothetical protein